MQKLPAVEEAKTLLEAAKEWGVWKWLTDKKKVRETADKAWAAFDELEDKIKGSWPDDFRKAYAELMAQSVAEQGGAPEKRKYDKARKDADGVDAQVKAQAAKLKEADDQAYSLRVAAEDMFAEAEKRMSTSMAREASQKAIDAWIAREKLIRKFEAARSK